MELIIGVTAERACTHLSKNIVFLFITWLIYNSQSKMSKKGGNADFPID